MLGNQLSNLVDIDPSWTVGRRDYSGSQSSRLCVVGVQSPPPPSYGGDVPSLLYPTEISGTRRRPVGALTSRPGGSGPEDTRRTPESYCGPEQGSLWAKFLKTTHQVHLRSLYFRKSYQPLRWNRTVHPGTSTPFLSRLRFKWLHNQFLSGPILFPSLPLGLSIWDKLKIPIALSSLITSGLRMIHGPWCDLIFRFLSTCQDFFECFQYEILIPCKRKSKSYLIKTVLYRKLLVLSYLPFFLIDFHLLSSVRPVPFPPSHATPIIYTIRNVSWLS